MTAFAPIPGKCHYWREMLNVDDEYNTSIKAPKKRVDCSCFVEGDMWTFTVETVPNDCPRHMQCRYYIESS